MLWRLQFLTILVLLTASSCQASPSQAGAGHTTVVSAVSISVKQLKGHLLSFCSRHAAESLLLSGLLAHT